MFSLFPKIVVAVMIFASATASADLVLYTDRPTAGIAPVAAEFEARTGTKVVIVEQAFSALYPRMKAEKELGLQQFDLIFVKDMILLSQLSTEGFFQPSTSPALAGIVDSSMQDPNRLWTAVTFRARTLVYNPSRVDVAKINTYADLAKEEYAGLLCLRTSKANYNVALVASLIKNLGYDAAKSVVENWVLNLAVGELPDDNSVIEAIATGQCSVGITNSYYLAGYHAKNPSFPVAIEFLNQDSSGVHVNGSGIGVAKDSKQQALAESFIALMLEEKFQLQMSSAHLDYPARKGLMPNTFIKDWGNPAITAPGEHKFKIDQTNWAEIGILADQSKKLISDVNYQ